MTNQTGKPTDAATPSAPARQDAAAGAAFGVVTLTGQVAVAQAADNPTPGMPARPHRIQRKPRVRRATVNHRKPGNNSPPAAVPTPLVAAVPPPASNDAELRNWIKDNATLLSNVTLLMSIAALAIGLLPGEGWIEPYIQAILFGAAIMLVLELHNQWPEDLQLHLIRSVGVPANHSWRMTGFAFLLQLATILFAIWAAITTPLILFPLFAVGIVLLFRHFLYKRLGGRFAKVISIVSLVLVLLISELLILIVWAAVTNQTFTIELWPEERPVPGSDPRPSIEIGD